MQNLSLEILANGGLHRNKHFNIFRVNLVQLFVKVHNEKMHFQKVECLVKAVKKCFLKKLRARLIHVFKNWKLLFENICGNTCGWKSALKCVKCCLKNENGCLKIQTKHPLSVWLTLIKVTVWEINYQKRQCIYKSISSRLDKFLYYLDNQ